MNAVQESQPTIGEIARRLGEPIWRIEYLIRSRNINPASRAGNARVFTDADVELIAGVIKRINRDKGVANDRD
jgi:DNA-binding transcriptional MerR regulator